MGTVACLNYCEHIDNSAIDFRRCPFCKSNDVNIYVVPKWYEPGRYKHTVECNKCGGSTGEYDNVNEAIRIWDRR